MSSYRSRTSLRPDSTLVTISPGSALTLSVRNDLSTVRICETLITESLGSPEALCSNMTFPGASSSRRLDVTAATTIVLIRLWLNGSLWSTTTGLLNPGPEPDGGGSDAHHTSPRRTTTPRQAAKPIEVELRHCQGPKTQLNTRRPRLRGSSHHHAR